VARLLFALCRRGEAHRPYEESEGWAWYRWEDPDGQVGRVGLRTADHPDHNDQDELATQALTSAPLRGRSLVELAAVLARLAEYDGLERAWRLERVAELVYGPATRSSHRERQLPPLHGWLALLYRARWRLGTADGATNRSQRRAEAKRKPGRAIDVDQLLTIDRDTRVSATVRLHPELARALASSTTAIPGETFRLARAGHTNPWGNRPSLATKARTRLGAVLAHRPGGTEVDLESLLVRHAGVDLAPVTRRRRLATWLDDLADDLVAIGTRFGVGLAAAPARARRILSTVMSLVAPEPRSPGPRTPASPNGAPRPPPRTAP
jgi:hypothetical protein